MSNKLGFIGCGEMASAIIKGLMIESYIEEGAQSPDGGVYGKYQIFMHQQNQTNQPLQKVKS